MIVRQNMTMIRSRISRSTLAVLLWTCLWVACGLVALHRTRGAMLNLQNARHAPHRFGVTRELLDFQWLLRVPGAEGRFTRLVREDAPYAKLFGICGLYLIHSEEFATARDRLSTDTSEIELGSCLRLTTQIRTLVPRLPESCPYFKKGAVQWAAGEISWLLER